MNTSALRGKKERYVIGLTSDAACQGVDMALTRIKGSGADLHLKLIAHDFLSYEPGIRTRLTGVRTDARDLAILDFDLGEVFATAARRMMRQADEEKVEPDFIGSMGHTAAHAPIRGDSRPGELTLGESAVIARRTGLPVVSDFPPHDMAMGGQGAPLEAYADWVLFRRIDRSVLSLHIGGLSRMTVVTPSMDNVMAFHVGPGVAAMDGAVQLLTGGGHQGDPEGAMAARGVVIDEFLDLLLEHPFLNRVPPKSTSREEFGPENYLREAISTRKGLNHHMDDFSATATTAVAFSIIRAYTRFVKPHHTIARVIVSGPGAANEPLMAHIRKGLGELVFRKSDDYGLPGKSLTSVAAAILANEYICGVPANIPHATGARHSVRLGTLTRP